uniref:Uncharacterized protein n=1 Tax=Colletotrichum gloeosporioides partitivirus 1 TaxID=2603562 RepID=A0A5B9BJ03_9VIRU|nr:hypothetical protein [Colletotrichum gloeosporioides partitivirus 1]
MEGRLCVARNKVPVFQPGRFNPVVELVFQLPELPVDTSLDSSDEQSFPSVKAIVSSAVDPYPNVPAPKVSPPQQVPPFKKEHLTVLRSALREERAVLLESETDKHVVPVKDFFSCPSFLEPNRSRLPTDVLSFAESCRLPHDPGTCQFCQLGPTLTKVHIESTLLSQLASEYPQGLVDFCNLCQLYPGTSDELLITYKNIPGYLSRHLLTVSVYKHKAVCSATVFCRMYSLDPSSCDFSSLTAVLVSLVSSRTTWPDIFSWSHGYDDEAKDAVPAPLKALLQSQASSI